MTRLVQWFEKYHFTALLTYCQFLLVALIMQASLAIGKPHLRHPQIAVSVQLCAFVLMMALVMFRDRIRVTWEVLTRHVAEPQVWLERFQEMKVYLKDLQSDLCAGIPLDVALTKGYPFWFAGLVREGLLCKTHPLGNQIRSGFEKFAQGKGAIIAMAQQLLAAKFGCSVSKIRIMLTN